MLRSLALALVVSLLIPAAASAQTAPSGPAPGASTRSSSRGGDITRDEYIERARRSAAERFDRMDANHDGVLTIDERRAYRATRRGSREPAQ